MDAGPAFFIDMNICDLKRGARASVLRVECEGEERARLLGFGLSAGSEILLLKVSPFKRNYLLQAGNTKFALGREIAEKVRVWPK